MSTYRHTDFEYINVAIGWKNAWLVIAVRRYREFLVEVGVPERIANYPDPAIAAARAALRETPRSASEFEEIVAEFLEGIEEQYGQDIAEELVAWAVRHFIDGRFGMALHGWSNMLPKLAGAYFPDHDPEVLSPLNPTSTERFREIVRSHFVYSDVFRIKRRIWRAASSNELSSEELEWLSLPPDDFRSEREFFELGQLVDTLIGFCKAIQAWLAIEAVFTEEEVSLIRDWAVRESIEDGWSEDSAVRRFQA